MVEQMFHTHHVGSSILPSPTKKELQEETPTINLLTVLLVGSEI